MQVVDRVNSHKESWQAAPVAAPVRWTVSMTITRLLFRRYANRRTTTYRVDALDLVGAENLMRHLDQGVLCTNNYVGNQDQ